MRDRDDDERDAFMRTLAEVALDVGWDLERQRQHPLFVAMLTLHGAQLIRQWLLLDAIRTAGTAELFRRLELLQDETDELHRTTGATILLLSDEQWRALYRKHGLEMECGPLGNPALLNSDWLDAETLRRLCDYYAHTSLRG